MIDSYQQEKILSIHCEKVEQRPFRKAVIRAGNIRIDTVDMSSIDRSSVRHVVDGIKFGQLMVKLGHQDRSWANGL